MWVLAFVLLRQYNGTSFNMFAVLDPTCRHCFPPVLFLLSRTSYWMVFRPIDCDIKTLEACR